MKLHKVLSVNGQPFDLISDDVRLDLRSPGRASFTLKADAPLRGLVTLDIGYNERPLQRHFLGYIERCTAANSREQLLLCREAAAVLTFPLPLALRHVNLSEVLVAISQQTGLRFRVPEADYARVKTPYFYSLAAGIQAMDSLAQMFGIPDFIWQQQGDGEVYVGSWADSYWGARPPLQLPVELFDQYQGNQSATVTAIPGLRPGASINQGQRITAMTLAGTEMAIQWKRQ
ncbi:MULTISPECIES: hypothetical protein [unclassified Pseudomonas]|uniref:hypothetical protein n=1 Tax=unclassified Pseudomonas TaxID=196821 RepID=UPI000C2FE914|nr:MULTISPECIES: hypothetical protein [unclassified Pseudomonas]MCU1740022.1 hypothetical protein [Pseudomonas sp. 20S_6.2_Bac1]